MGDKIFSAEKYELFAIDIYGAEMLVPIPLKYASSVKMLINSEKNKIEELSLRIKDLEKEQLKLQAIIENNILSASYINEKAEINY